MLHKEVATLLFDWEEAEAEVIQGSFVLSNLEGSPDIRKGIYSIHPHLQSPVCVISWFTNHPPTAMVFAEVHLVCQNVS